MTADASDLMRLPACRFKPDGSPVLVVEELEDGSGSMYCNGKLIHASPGLMQRLADCSGPHQYAQREVVRHRRYNPGDGVDEIVARRLVRSPGMLLAWALDSGSTPEAALDMYERLMGVPAPEPVQRRAALLRARLQQSEPVPEQQLMPKGITPSQWLIVERHRQLVEHEARSEMVGCGASAEA